MGIQVFAFLLLGLAIPTLISCNKEGDILIKQKTLWTDPNGVLQSWNRTSGNPCEWFRVTCNNDMSLIRLDLGNGGLSGPLNPELGSLKNLQYLEINTNNISGMIPADFGNLSSLVSLDLYENSLTGDIPSSLGKLKSLQYLRLNGNKLTGTVPTEVLDLVNTGSLIQMNVSDNSLTGTGTVGSSQPRVTTITQSTLLCIVLQLLLSLSTISATPTNA